MAQKNNTEAIASAHFIGIGGAGMSGIALVLHERGCKVSGSDLKESRYVRDLWAAGIDVRETPFAMSGGERISSTRIRAAVRSGDLAAAAAMLGRPFALCGAVRPGKGEGRKLGFPTVNIVPAAGMCLPPRGAYAIDGGVANFGTAPTFGEDALSEPVLEAHYFARPPDFPDGGAEVPLLRFLRPERRFADVASLRAQIAMDIAAAKSAGNGCGTGPDLHG